jgi:predicted transcriptional regulator
MEDKKALNNLYTVQIESLLTQQEMQQEYRMEVREFFSMEEVFKVLGDKKLEHTALINDEEQAVEISFVSLQRQLHQNKSISMLLFYSREHQPGSLH